MLLQEVERGNRRLVRRQRVDNDPACLAPDEGDIGEVEAANLVDAVRDLEQAVLGVHLALAPQARVDGFRLALIEKVELLHVENDATQLTRDLTFFECGDEATLGVLEVGFVVER